MLGSSSARPRPAALPRPEERAPRIVSGGRRLRRPSHSAGVSVFIDSAWICSRILSPSAA